VHAHETLGELLGALEVGGMLCEVHLGCVVGLMSPLGFKLS
jgi:hypothetical protein